MTKSKRAERILLRYYEPYGLGGMYSGCEKCISGMLQEMVEMHKEGEIDLIRDLEEIAEEIRTFHKGAHK